MRKLSQAIIHVALILFTIFAVIPFVWMFVMSFKDNAQIFNTPLKLPDSWSFSNYTEAISIMGIGTLLKNTLFVAVFSTFFQGAFSFVCAYLIVRIPSRFSKVLYVFLLTGLSIPAQILMYPIGMISYSTGVMGSLWALILPYIGFAISFNVLVYTGFIRGLPTDMEEASIIDGCGFWNMLLRIVVPLCAPGLITIMVFNFLFSWTEYNLAMVLTQSKSKATISMGMAMFKTNYTIDYGQLAAASMMVVAIELIYYSCFQKYIVGGLTAGAVKG